MTETDAIYRRAEIKQQTKRGVPQKAPIEPMVHVFGVHIGIHIIKLSEIQ